MKYVIKFLAVTTLIALYSCAQEVLAQENDSTILQLIIPIITKKRNATASYLNATASYSLRVGYLIGCPPSPPHPNAGMIGFSPSTDIYSIKNTSGTSIQLIYTIYDNIGRVTKSGTLTETSTFLYKDTDGTIVTRSEYPYMWIDNASRIFEVEAKATLLDGTSISDSRNTTFDPSFCN